MRRRRLRKWAKWACTVAAVAALCVAVFSKFYCVGGQVVPSTCSSRLTATVDGGLIVVWNEDASEFRVFQPGAGVWHLSKARGWSWGMTADGWRAGFICERGLGFWGIGFSVLYPVLLTALPAALLWYADRRRSRPGSCGRCGYDRAGLAPTSPCPECGTTPTP